MSDLSYVVLQGVSGIRGLAATELERHVMDAIAKGYIPAGGVCIDATTNQWIFAQAMWLREIPEAKPKKKPGRGK